MFPKLNRRHWLSMSASAGCLGLGTRLLNADEPASNPILTGSAGDGEKAVATRVSICVFTKPFNSLSYEALAARVAEAGFDGIEAPVRAGGNVEPSEVAAKLPKLHAALKSCGLNIPIITTNITQADDQESQAILKTASDLGIRRFRMGYVKYDTKRPISEQLDGWRRQFEELASICKELNIQGLYQNHAGGKYMGAPIWDLDRVLTDIDPRQIGVAYDIRHATVEGGTSWPVTWRMIRPRVGMVYVKDFDWVEGKVTNVPLGKGRISPGFLKCWLRVNIAAPFPCTRNTSITASQSWCRNTWKQCPLIA